MKQSITDTPWEITVAYAAPATPISKPFTNRISSPIFTKVEITRKYKGALLLPIALIIPANIL